MHIQVYLLSCPVLMHYAGLFDEVKTPGRIATVVTVDIGDLNTNDQKV